MKQGIKRIYLLDEIRGIAILAMIVHHAFLDVGTVLGLDWGYEIFNFLCCFQPLFWTAFILISGICSQLSRNSVKRGAVVFAAAVLITFVTAVVMPKLNMMKSEIYFDITLLGYMYDCFGIVKKTNRKYEKLYRIFNFDRLVFSNIQCFKRYSFFVYKTARFFV